MPHYEFRCEKCKKAFELTMTISEREKAKPQCPTCKGAKVIPQLSGFMGQTVKNGVFPEARVCYSQGFG